MSLRMARRTGLPVAFAVFVLLSAIRVTAQHSASPTSVPSDAHVTPVQPFLTKNCVGCHNDKLKSGDVSLSGLKPVGEDPELWEKVPAKLRDGTMPPKPMPRPVQADTDATVAWIK